MRTIDLCLYIAAAVQFVMAAYQLAWRKHTDTALFFLALGLLAWVLVPFLDLFQPTT